MHTIILLLIVPLPLLLFAVVADRFLKKRTISRDTLLHILFPLLLAVPVLGVFLPRFDMFPKFTKTETVESVPTSISASSSTPISTPSEVEPFPKEIAFDAHAVEPLPQTASLPQQFSFPEPIAAPRSEPIIKNFEAKIVSINASQNKQETVPQQSGLPFRYIIQMLLVFWGIGMLFDLTLVFRSLWLYRNIIRRARPLTEPDWTQTCKEIEANLTLSRRVRYLVSDEIAVPQVVALLTPTVLLPDSLVLQKPGRAILIHELTHIRRKDIFWQLLASFVCTIYWFQPLVWFFAAVLREVREKLCDDQVLLCGEKGSEHAAVLLNWSS